MRLSKNLEYLKPSETLAISHAAQQRRSAGEDVVDLSAGEPDFDTPRIAAEAGIRSIQQGKTHYPPNQGLLDLRAAAARHFSLLSGGRPVNADHIVVSSGAKQSLFNTCFVLFGSGDKVLVPAPYWVSYPQMLRFARAEPVIVPGAPEWSMKVSVEDLERERDSLTRGLLFSSPCNPTGAVYTRAELKAIAEWAHKHEIWMISDEIYRRIHYGPGPAPSVLDLPDELLERVVMISGVSKAYAMTGWRIGLALAPGPVAKAMAGLQSHTTSGAAQASQWAAVAAFGDDRIEQDVDRMVEAFRGRRDLVEAYFRKEMAGVEFVDPVGAFYFFFRVDHLFGQEITTAAGFCERLINREGVALVPGDAFGDTRWVRLSYAASEEELNRALERIARCMRSL
ncbi:MAG: pyridoxal phosphate-dependent aminotransferase [Gemmatimonadota bacterium]|nr:pyridoxal phosphate-dependent aminotransferase [Gemmatimonadota bacterium]